MQVVALESRQATAVYRPPARGLAQGGGLENPSKRDFDFSDDDEDEDEDDPLIARGRGTGGNGQAAMNLCRRNTNEGNPRQLVWCDSSATNRTKRGTTWHERKKRGKSGEEEDEGARTGMSARLASYISTPGAEAWAGAGNVGKSSARRRNSDRERREFRAVPSDAGAGSALAPDSGGGFGHADLRAADGRENRADVTKTAKMMFEYEAPLTGKCRVMYVEKVRCHNFCVCVLPFCCALQYQGDSLRQPQHDSQTVVVRGPRTRSSANDTAQIVDLIGGADWLSCLGTGDGGGHDDQRWLDASGQEGGQIVLSALIEKCGSEDNVLVFGVKELRNSLSSAGYRYWKRTEAEEIFLPAHLHIKLSPEHKVPYQLRAASASNLWVIYCRLGALPCSFTVEAGVILEPSKLIPDPEPVRKPRLSRKKLDEDQADGADQEKKNTGKTKVRTIKANKNAATGSNVVSRCVGQAGVQKIMGNGRGKDVWRSEDEEDEEEDEEGDALRFPAVARKDREKSVDERKILAKLDRFHGGPSTATQESQPLSGNHGDCSCGADGDDDDWVTAPI